MKYVDVVMDYMPSGLWTLDGDLLDYSGLSQSGTRVSGTEINVLPCTYGSTGSVVVGAGSVLRFPTKIYSQVKGPVPFTIIASLLPISVTSEVPVLSHDSVLDGVTIDSTRVHFSVNSLTETFRVSGEYPSGAIQVAVTFDTRSIFLYINGEMMDSANIESLTYPSFSNFSYLYSGQGTGTVGLDSVSTFDFAMSGSQINGIYLASTGNQPENAAHQSTDVVYVNVSDPVYDPYVVKTWDDWEDAQYSGVTIDDTGVYSETGGEWKTSLMLSDIDTAFINDSRISWVGESVTVQTSFDNSTWTTAVSGGKLPGVSYPFDVTGKCLFIKVTFGMASELTALGVSTYKSINFYSSDTNRAVTVSGTVFDAESNSIPSQTNDIGMTLAPGSLKILSDSSGDPRSSFAIEFMVKVPSGSPNFTVFSNSTGTVSVSYSSGNLTATGASSLIINGASKTVGSPSPVVVGTWIHVGLIFTSQNVDFMFGTNSSGTQTSTFFLTRPVVYTSSITLAALQENFRNLFSRSKLTFDVGTLSISQNPVHKTYNNSWTTA